MHSRHFLLIGLCALGASSSALAQPVVSVVAGAPAGAVTPGQSVTMSVSATGGSLGYQWMLNGTAIPGATGAGYTMMAGAADDGVYQVAVSGDGGTTTVGIGTMTVAASDARLMNLSARGVAGTGGNTMITGFVSDGPADATKTMLIRGMGPSLSGMMGGMMSGILNHPVLTVYDGHSMPMGSDMGWLNTPQRATGADASDVSATMMGATSTMMNAVGAFAPTSGSTDSAIMMTAPAGAYTATVTGASGTPGIALAECYDADAAADGSTGTARLINMSARANVGTGANVLIAGFVIAAGPSGSDTTVLIRAMGPGLGALGLTGTLPKPMLTLYDATSKPIASNTGWGNMPVVATGSTASPVRAGIEPATSGVMARVGAFGPTAGSADCALVATLPPGSYSAVVSGTTDASGQPATGVCLVEVYEIR